MKGNRLIEYPKCGKFFQSLGYARHRAMHYEQRIKESDIEVLRYLAPMQCGEKERIELCKRIKRKS